MLVMVLVFEDDFDFGVYVEVFDVVCEVFLGDCVFVECVFDECG